MSQAQNANTYLWIVERWSEVKSGVKIKSNGLLLDAYSSSSFFILDLNCESFLEKPIPFR